MRNAFLSSGNLSGESIEPETSIKNTRFADGRSFASGNRNGGTGYIDLYFYKQWLRFEDMLDPDR